MATGEFTPIDEDVAHGDTGILPQDALEDQSNQRNVFQFIRVEDIAYDPVDPRTRVLHRHRRIRASSRTPGHRSAMAARVVA